MSTAAALIRPSSRPGALRHARQWQTSTSLYAPEQIPLPLSEARTLLPAPVERGSLPTGELRHRCARFMQALAEVIAGVRPVRQMSPWLTREVYQELATYVDDTYRGMVGAPRHQARIVSVHLSMVDDHAAEVAARMVRRGRSHAIAIRLQYVTDARDRPMWRCTALSWA